jgi:hypothetical protein
MKRSILSSAVAVALALAAPVAFADAAAKDQKAPDFGPNTESTRPADNTRVNTRDKSGATKVPTDQSNAKFDLELAAAVRKAIVEDKSLSTLAHNVKVVTQGGTVTLRGPVQTADEKNRIGQVAQRTAGVTRVENQLDIKQR